jgi:hypothetical protein
LALFVLDHAALVVELLLRDGAEQMPHAIRLHPQREIERRGRHGLKIVGPVEPGGAVHAGRADALHRLEPLAVVVLRAVEHQMLEQMREAGLARGLVLRADVVPDADGDDRGFTVLVDDHGQALATRNGRMRGQRRRARCLGITGTLRRSAGNERQPAAAVATSNPVG